MVGHTMSIVLCTKSEVLSIISQPKSAWRPFGSLQAVKDRSLSSHQVTSKAARVKAASLAAQLDEDWLTLRWRIGERHYLRRKFLRLIKPQRPEVRVYQRSNAV